MDKVAILVDGDFYLRRAFHHWGDRTPKERADELHKYCMRHLRHSEFRKNQRIWVRDDLYRIFFYDCPPSEKQVYNPLSNKTENMKLSSVYSFRSELHQQLKYKRKLALRFGELREQDIAYALLPDVMKKLLKGDRSLDSITQDDIYINISQKGVDMRIGLDIASMAYKKQVTKIILIAGDADFVPAAKLARREGIDFVLDPMGQGIAPSLNEHIDGLSSCTYSDPLAVKDELQTDTDSITCTSPHEQT